MTRARTHARVVKERAAKLREEREQDWAEHKKAARQEAIGFGVIGAGILAWGWHTGALEGLVAAARLGTLPSLQQPLSRLRVVEWGRPHQPGRTAALKDFTFP
jgi:hypothetical protein